MLFHSFCKEFGNTLTGGSDPGCLMKLQLGYKVGLQSPVGLCVAEGTASKMACSHDY